MRQGNGNDISDMSEIIFFNECPNEVYDLFIVDLAGMITKKNIIV